MKTSHLAHQINERRVRLGMSKTALARCTGLSIATVNRFLSGREARPSLACVAQLARALGLEVRVGVTTSIREVGSAADVREARARETAARLVRMVQGTMALEGEAVSPDAVERLEEEATRALLAGSSRRLWG